MEGQQHWCDYDNIQLYDYLNGFDSLGVPTGDEEGLLEIVQESVTIGHIYRKSAENHMKNKSGSTRIHLKNSWSLEKSLKRRMKAAKEVLMNDTCIKRWVEESVGTDTMVSALYACYDWTDEVEIKEWMWILRFLTHWQQLRSALLGVVQRMIPVSISILDTVWQHMC